MNIVQGRLGWPGPNAMEEIRYGGGSTYMHSSHLYELGPVNLLCAFARPRFGRQTAFLRQMLGSIVSLMADRAPAPIEALLRYYRRDRERCFESPEHIAEWLARLYARPVEQRVSTTDDLAAIDSLGPRDVAQYASKCCRVDRFFLFFCGIFPLLDTIRMRRLVRGAFADKATPLAVLTGHVT